MQQRTQDETQAIVASLQEAASRIENGYWYRGSSTGNPELIVLADGTVVAMPHLLPGRTGGCLATTIPTGQAQDVLMRYIGVQYVGDVYQVNDAWPATMEGRQKAISTLRDAADAVMNGRI